MLTMSTKILVNNNLAPKGSTIARQNFMLLRLDTLRYAHAYRTCKLSCAFLFR